VPGSERLTLAQRPLCPRSNAEETTLAYTGEGAAGVPLSPFKNLITRTALYVLRAHGIRSLPPHLHVAVANGVPFGRGLGSSGAAVIAGVLLGSLLGDLDLPLSRLLDFALMVERHPDNVSAALVGGFVGSYLRELSPLETSAAEVPLAEVLPEYPADAGPDWGLDPPIPPRGIGHFVRFGWAKEIKAIAIVPRFELSTAKARGVLPEAYTRKDMVRLRDATRTQLARAVC
jgi:homoserine kinase